MLLAAFFLFVYFHSLHVEEIGSESTGQKAVALHGLQYSLARAEPGAFGQLILALFSLATTGDAGLNLC